MRSIRLAFLGVLLAAGFSPAARADLLVLSPGVIYWGGIQDLATQFTKSTGIKVTVKPGGMTAVITGAKSGAPAPDVVVLPIEPYDLMGSLSMEGGIVRDTFTPIGRVEFGLAVAAGAPKPDISTVEKFVAALKSAKQVMRSDPGKDLTPGRGSMVALIIDTMLKRPEFAGVNSKISTNGEGGEALSRGDGDMALQAICEILPHKEIALVGPVPRELYVHMDMAAAVAARSANEKDARAFIAFLMRPQARAVWKARGVDRF